MTEVLFWILKYQYQFAICFNLVFKVFKVFDRIKIVNKCQYDCLFYKKKLICSFLKRNGSLRIDNWLLGCPEQDINNRNMD